ncbi:MAG: pyrroline-5-carboxylate reductase family protein [Ruminococcus callidus]
MNTIGFIGAGNMGSAILRGIAGSDMKPEAELFAYNPTEAKVDALADCGVQKCKSAAEVVEKSRYVFLAIKPQKFEEVLPQIADAVTEQTVLVSIAAGIGADFIRKMTKPFAKVVLAMPNTPLLLGEGATALAKDDAVSDAEFAVVQRIFGSCGMTLSLREQMKEVIAINGSSPAFIYLFASFLDYAAKWVSRRHRQRNCLRSR